MPLYPKPSGSASFTAPTFQKLLSTGTTTGYLFTVTSANATVGATYTNNGNTYTVLATIAAATQLFCSQAAAPLSSGTLTKASGTGDATITFSAFQALATYTTPASPAPLYLKIRMIAGGGGGGGAGTSSTGGGTGGQTAFGPSLLSCLGGTGGSPGTANGTGAGGAGGTSSLGTGPVGLPSTGNAGHAGADESGAITALGAGGGTTVFGGGTAYSIGVGVAAANNSGAGGSGSANGGVAGGGGGGAGGMVDAIITSPAGTYVYLIGAGGAAGGTGTGGGAGGAGGSGVVVVEEHYQ